MNSKTTETNSPEKPDRWIQFHDERADEQGRRHFSLYWLREGDLPGTASTFSFRGTRRGQVFFCDPTRFADATPVERAPWDGMNAPEIPEGSAEVSR